MVARGRRLVEIAVVALDKMGQDQADDCAAEVKVAVWADMYRIHIHHISACSGLVQGHRGIYTQHL